MAKETPIINILTFGLPFKLTNQIFNEYQDRIRESNYFIDNVAKYNQLRKYIKTVEILLALSIFHKRVISNLNAAVKFHGPVLDYSNSDIIKIGKYELNTIEKNKILGLIINYNQLMKRYCIPDSLWDYSFTKEFLSKHLQLQLEIKNAENQFKKERRENEEDEVPF